MTYLTTVFLLAISTSAPVDSTNRLYGTITNYGVVDTHPCQPKYFGIKNPRQVSVGNIDSRILGL